ncbi:ABC transporter ATP-binding protein [Vibrio vulnificus]|uniref:peptidase domain-containing ABC transporter n=1 Tax=Vibrio vulnificus TaxID=672 RepID=UPI000500566A|nr:peptidase domain-containing ABC transporter [Vibrio vulnificus]EJV2651556.1 peptidase domain-containing ABC transporter [Vibrio vulnificus]KFK51298.1 ABC transporter ATP-binding protein [Vibrio vulnificus]HDY8226388.1 peptidase domain-containing ABC transporter [Vibrio vulnificus]HDY8230052.1 peptidase domain-containing ABC transporter [Vibrio vulnificus]
MTAENTSGANFFNPKDLLNFYDLKRVPLIMQSEVAECGLASLAMILSFHGNNTDLHCMRKRAQVSSKGMNLRDIVDLASNLDLSSRALKCSLDEVKDLKLPCILHWDFDHFVVLTKVTKNAVHINDPGVGKRKISINELSKSFTGIAVEFTPTSQFRPAENRTTMKINQLWENITGLNKTLFLLIGLTLVMQLMSVLFPYYLQWTIDEVLISEDKPLLLVLAIGFSLLTVLNVLVSSFRQWLVVKFSSQLSIQMGANIFFHLLRLPTDYFEKRSVGDVISRFKSLTYIRDLMTEGLVESTIDGLMAALVLAMMYLYSPLLATLVLVTVLISFVIQMFFYYPTRRISEELLISEAKEDSTFLESVRAIKTIKTFGHESVMQNLWLNRYAEVINSDIRLSKLAISEEAFNKLIFGFENILIIYFGAILVIEGQLSVGMILAFISYKVLFTTSIRTFIDKFIEFKMLSLHLGRLSDITLQQRELRELKSPMSLVSEPTITLENVSFKFSSNDDWVFRNLNFEFKPNLNTVITGSSGCGKSTLLKIVLGLVKPTYGRVLINGCDIQELTPSDYRSIFGVVMQDDVLLSGTLEENITMFDSDVNYELMRESCRAACILEEIESLPMGFHSLVGDMGSCFSGGQLQRVFLARALYRRPKILCLDESTSHLDMSNEKAILENIKGLNVTTISIAHRRETINSADCMLNLTGLIETTLASEARKL